MNTTAAHHVLLPEDYADDTGIIFGQSQFKGRTGWAPHLHRWVVQYISLLIKNFLVMVRRPVQSSMFMLLPAAIVLVFLIEQNPSSSSSAVPITVPVDNLGECNVAHTSNCVRVVYSPESEITTPIMNRFSEINQLQVGKDVLPFSSISSAREYVASNLGTVQFTLFFRNESLWETEQYSPTEVALAKNLSYTVFHNTSISDKDSRSKEFGMSFPLMVLQKTLEQAYLETFFAGQYQGYSVNYGQSTAVTVTSNSSSTPTACQKPLRSEFSNLTTVMMWVQMFAFLMLSNVTLQLIGEERRKHLFNSLRRLGLLDTAYWLSWFTTFLVFLSLGCCIAMIVAVIVRAKSSTLRDIDLGLLFLQLWMSGCAYISFSMSLGALCSSQSIATAISLTVFVVALITVAASSTTLNSYGVFYDFESNVVVGSCKLITSSYNFVYSDTLPAHTFVQFLVYWLPWFHSSQAMSNILSLVQVDGQSVGMADATTNIKLVTSSGSQFDSRWIAWSYYMMLLNGLLYLITSWLAGQLVSSEGTEGRNIFSVLLPSVLRNYIFSKGEVIEGDVRGEQRSMSIQEGSIRAYKVSKTFSGVQAVKEVSFSLSRGQVSCLLGHNGAGNNL